ncbi:hypothetical protein HBI29_184590 [Parastagonospora nodorum]|nr:hypothetical protein HBI29_184590 [Parastagonospora nodorum]
MPSVAFISNVYIADSLCARTLINLSVVLLRARTLINLSAVLYEQADARSSLSAEVSIIDLNFVPSVAFNAIGNVELTDDLLALLAKQIKTNEDRKKDNIEELIYVSKVKHTYVQAYTVSYSNLKKYLSNSTENLAYNISKFYKSKNIQLLRPIFKLQRYDYYNLQDRLIPRELGSIYVLRIISKLDKVPTRELSSYIKTELYLHQKQALYFMLRDNSRKFYRLVITSKDTHYKQTIKKAYIMLLERASLILFII